MNELRQRWLEGLCPCCGGELIPWPAPNGEDIRPEVVAEYVMICGRCIGNEHHIRPPEVMEEILRRLAESS